MKKLVLVALLLARPALAGWASLGAMPPPQREAHTLLFRSAQGTATVSVLAPDVVRVRFAVAVTDRAEAFHVRIER